ncbi:MAG TPA: ABC transporter permease subunit [Rectinemataceae bacterium]|nr:ABC transporter permease subunit [Rectinemataceae bacterium]
MRRTKLPIPGPGERAKFPRPLASGALGVAVSLIAWQILSTAIGSSLILPGPLEVADKLGSIFSTTSFWQAILGTLERVLFSFFLSVGLGALTGAASGLRPWIKDFLAPLLTTIRATPVLALILVAMFWLPSTGVPIFSAFLMAYPIVHTSAYAGIVSIDRELLEMASVFKVPPTVQFFRLRLPAARGHFLSGAKSALGLCWKVVVAGEVLSQPAFALGSGLQDARLSLETGSVLAWAAVTVFLCGVSEFLLGLLAKRFAETEGGASA